MKRGDKTFPIENVLAYTGRCRFPQTQTLAASLVPSPRYGAIRMNGAPTGDSQYDSSQIKSTTCLSHGLQVGDSFTWARALHANSYCEDRFNPQIRAVLRLALQQIPPLDLNLNAIYTVPRASFFPSQVGEADRQGLATRILRQLPKRHVSDTAR